MSIAGVAWPTTWRKAPLWSMFRRVKDVGHPDEEMLSVYREHGVVRKESRDDNFNKTAENRNIYQLVDDGWLIVNRMKAWQGSLGVSPYRGIVSGHYICFEPTHHEDSRFLNYLLRSSVYRVTLHQMSRGVRPNQIEIDNDELRALPLHLPGLAEQRAIADYLDAETARIDALIAKKQQLIHLLEERWGQYVRRELRSAGRVVPLKRGWTVTDCKHRTATYEPSGYPVVSPGDATPGRLDLSRCHRSVNQDDFADLTGGGRRPQRGDIVYSRNASIGIACYVDTDEPFCMGQDVCLITSRTNDCLFLAYALNSLGVDQLEELKLGSTFSRVNISQILELEVPLPSPEQQREAASRIDDRKRLHDRTLGAITRQVELLSEHRQALVTAAVSGTQSR